MATTEVSPNLIRRVLSEHEQALLRHVGRGKSLGAIAQLYRQYGGENGVREAIDEIRRKLRAEDERSGHAERPLASSVADVAGAAEEDDNGGVPVRSVPAGSIRGAAGESAEHAPRVTPPKAPSPAARPSRPELAARPASPATNGGPPMPSPAELAQVRYDAVLEFLKAGPRPQSDIARAAGIPSGSITGVMQRLVDRGLVTRDKQAQTVVYARSNGSGPSAAQKPAQAPRKAPRAPSGSSNGHWAPQGAPVDSVAVWLAGVDGDGLRAAIVELRERLEAYEQFEAALAKVADLAAPTPTG